VGPTAASVLGGGPITAVLFDYGLTLVEFDRPVAAIEAAQIEIAHCIGEAGHRPPAPEELRSAVHERVAAEVVAHEESGALEEIDVAELERRAFADLGLDLDAEVRDRCSRIAQEAWFQGVRPYPEVKGVLRTLRLGGLRLGVCSNAAYRPASMREQLAHVGLSGLVDAAVFSAEVGWRKPSPRIFTAALEAVGSSASSTVFVGDRPREDVTGANNAGMRTVLVQRNAASPRAIESDAQPDAVLISLAELPALLLGSAADVTIVGKEN
jgi:HAD superfamily hydrolase (TIGR01662 family)